MPKNETRRVPATPRKQSFGPMDRSPLEARRERVTVRRDTPNDTRQEQRDILDCFRVNRYGK